MACSFPLLVLFSCVAWAAQIRMREQGPAGLYMFGISYASWIGCGSIKLFVRQRVGTRAGQAKEVDEGGTGGVRQPGRYDMARAYDSMAM